MAEAGAEPGFVEARLGGQGDGGGGVHERGVQLGAIRREMQECARTAGAGEQFDQREEPEAKREAIARLDSNRGIDRAGPAAGIRVGQREMRARTVAAAKPEGPRRAADARERRLARGVPGGGEIPPAHRRQRLGRQIDKVRQAAVRAGAHGNRVCARRLSIPLVSGLFHVRKDGPAIAVPPAYRDHPEGQFHMADAARLTATEAARRIEAGTLTPADLMEACLARIAEREPRIHAFAHFDLEAARQAVGRALAGRLHGLPVGVKDVFDTADMPSEYNSPIWRGHRPRADAAAVAWTRAAGGVVIGKTVTTEFAVRHPGPTVNPHNPAHTPGGSSSGSAAGVAECFFPFAFGTQTAGSVIRPAAFCGVVGYKPSYGLISRVGLKMMSDTLDTVGTLGRTVADCALLAGAAGRRDFGDPEAKPERPPRVGICRTPSWRVAAPETQALLPDVARRLARAGAWVEDRELPEAFNAMEQARPIVQFAESAHAIGWELTTAREQVSAELMDLLEPAMRHSPETVDAARATLVRMRQAFPPATEGLDVLVTPSAPGEAPAGLGWTGDPAFNYLWTSMHVPCVTVPAGKGPKGLPLGIQIVGRYGEDRALLAWAQWVAAAIG